MPKEISNFNNPGQLTTEEIETKKFEKKSLEEAAKNSYDEAFEWFEESYILNKENEDKDHRIELELGVGPNGTDRAYLKQFNTKTGQTETIYFTKDPGEIERLMAVRDGKVIVKTIDKLPEQYEDEEEEDL